MTADVINMDCEFFVTLISDNERGNTHSNFSVQLPDTVRLHGSWKVALVDISYIENRPTLLIPGDHHSTICVEYGRQFYMVKIPEGEFASIDKLCEAISSAISDKKGVEDEENAKKRGLG